MMLSDYIRFSVVAAALLASSVAVAQTPSAGSASGWMEKLPAADRQKIEGRYAALVKSIDQYEQTATALKDSIRKTLEALSPKERELFISRLEQRAGAARMNARSANPSRAGADEKRFAADFEAAKEWYAALSEQERDRVDGRYATYSALMLDFHRASGAFKTKVDGLMKNAPAQEKTLFAGRVRAQIKAE
jgi:hypothetical protein